MRASTRTIVASSLMALSSSVSAQLASICPSTGVCFKLNIPASTASSGNGDIFFQISAPSTYEWVALGQGTSMTSSNQFVVYTNSDNTNVTLSPRTASGHVEPEFNSAAQVTLLEGSGVKDGVMTANVQCSNCNSWTTPSGSRSMDFTSSSGTWVYAYQSSNGPKRSDDQSASIREHTEHAVFSWNFANAKGGSSVNPLVAAANTASGGSGTAAGQPNNNGSNGNSDSDSNGSSNTGFTRISTGGSSRDMLIAHGVLASLAFVILFPAGSIAIRLASFPGIIWIHAIFQGFAYIVYIAAFGLGVHIAKNKNLLGKNHPIIGIVVLVVLFFQPILGWMHHAMFKKQGQRTLWSQAHIWVGRIAITLGIINGGLGMKLAKCSGLSSKTGEIVYAVVAGLMWLAWVAASFIGEQRRMKGVPSKYTASKRNGSGESGVVPSVE